MISKKLILKYRHRLQSSSCNRSIHQIAVTGFNSSNADRYDLYRPKYSSECIKYICDVICSSHSSSDHKILELGAGTGKFTTSFLEHQTITKAVNAKRDASYVLYATDPSVSFLNKILPEAASSTFTVGKHVASGSDISCIKDDHTCSAVIIAQAFHWMSSIETLREVHRVLAPAAPLILVWNIWNLKIDWLRVLEYDIIGKWYSKLEHQKDDGSSRIPRFITGEWENVFENQSSRDLYRPVSGTTTGNSIVDKWKCYQSYDCTRDDIIGRVFSISIVQSLIADDKSTLVDEINQLLDTHPDTRGRTMYKVEYETTVACTYSK